MKIESKVIQLKIDDNTPEQIEEILNKYLNTGYELNGIYQNGTVVFVVFTLKVAY